jgi:hypothetical protein
MNKMSHSEVTSFEDSNLDTVCKCRAAVELASEAGSAPLPDGFCLEAVTLHHERDRGPHPSRQVAVGSPFL